MLLFLFAATANGAYILQSMGDLYVHAVEIIFEVNQTNNFNFILFCKSCQIITQFCLTPAVSYVYTFKCHNFNKVLMARLTLRYP